MAIENSLVENFVKSSLAESAFKRAENVAAQASLGDAKQRQKIAQEFSSFLYLEVLKAMRAATAQDDASEGEPLSRDLYSSMMDAEVARLAAERDISGFAKAVQRSLERVSVTAKPALEINNSNPAPPPADKIFHLTPPLEEGTIKWGFQRGRASPLQNLNSGGVNSPPAKWFQLIEPRPQAPVTGVISSSFGLRADPFTGAGKIHHGVDIAALAGSPVQAAAAGQVIFSGFVAGYGNMVEIDHGGGWATRYGHNSANLVLAGDKIAAGQRIALVGQTGRATGDHLHFEVRRDGKAVSPTPFLGAEVKGSRLSSRA